MPERSYRLVMKKGPNYGTNPTDVYPAYVNGMEPVGNIASEGLKYRAGFNGQEKDDEVSGSGNSNTAEFWQYDTRLGRRWNLDPKPNFSLSSYSAFANSPIWTIDVRGDTTWNFSTKTGDFIGLTNLKEKGNMGALVTITEKIAKDGSKSIDTKVDAIFDLNDLKLDMIGSNKPKDFRTGILNGTMKAMLINADDIDKAMVLGGAKTAEAKENPWTYIERESRPVGDESILSGESSGLFDFYGTSPIVRTGYIHVVLYPGAKVGIGYNDYDFGNFLWGHAGTMLGFNMITLSEAAHLNNAVNGKDDNQGKNTGWLDSPADQRAIFNGTKYPIKK